MCAGRTSPAASCRARGHVAKNAALAAVNGRPNDRWRTKKEKEKKREGHSLQVPTTFSLDAHWMGSFSLFIMVLIRRFATGGQHKRVVSLTLKCKCKSTSNSVTTQGVKRHTSYTIIKWFALPRVLSSVFTLRAPVQVTRLLVHSPRHCWMDAGFSLVQWMPLFAKVAELTPRCVSMFFRV